MIYPARHISIAIDRAPEAVAAFAGAPANLPLWAAGLSAGIREENGRWLTDSPMGLVEVRFAEGAGFGILDHEVIFPDGSVAHNPLRVLRNGEGSEVVFTLYRLPRTSDDDYARDAALVQADLERLRAVLEA